MLQNRYDKNRVHDLSEWLEIARAAVNMVSDAREIMDLLPLPSAGGPDNAIR